MKKNRVGNWHPRNAIANAGWMELWGAAKEMSHGLLTVSFLRSNFRSHRVLEACQADG